MAAAVAASTVNPITTAAAVSVSAFTKNGWIPKFVKAATTTNTTSTNRIKPKDFTIDCTRYQKNFASSEQLRNRIRETFVRTGLVYLTNTGSRDPTLLQKPFEDILGTNVVYEGGANPRSHIDGNVYDTGVAMESFVHYHHEMAYISKSVRNLAFFCTDLSPGVDGSTYVSDNIAVTNAIQHTQLGHKLKQKGICYVRKLTDREQFKDKPPMGVYNHWQKSFLTECPSEAEKSANSRGLSVEWGPNRHMITRYYISADEYCPYIDRNLLYVSAADHSIWFDTWPNVKQLPQEDRPLKLTYGDDTEFADDEIAEFVDIYDDFGMKLDWKVGEAALVCNYRFLHGRPIVQLEKGQIRNLGVVLGEVFDRMGPLPGKW